MGTKKFRDSSLRISSRTRVSKIPKISLCGELETRNQLFQETRTKDCREIEELRSRCCQESDKARQAKFDELSTKQQRNPQTVSQLTAPIRELQYKVNSLCDARDFHDPETQSISGASHVTSQPVTVPSTRTVLGRDSGLPHDTRNIMGISGNVFERPPAQQGHPQDYFENSKNSPSSSCRVKPHITDLPQRGITYKM